MSASLSLQNGVDVGSDDALDRRYEVADNAARDLLITQQKIKVGRVILHTGDNQHYKLKTYPTPGSLTGVVWEPFGEGKSLSDAEVKTKYENNANTNAFTDAEKSKLASLVNNYKGKYLTPSALTTSHPSPSESDAWAIVESTDTVWLWDGDTNQWKDSDKYAPQVELVNDLTTGGTSKAATAEMAKVLKGLIDALQSDLSLRVSKTSGTLTDGATVTVNGGSKDQATFDWTANTASVILVFSAGTAAQVTSIFGKKTLAGDVTVTLDTTNYHFVDASGSDISDIVITNDNSTNKYFELSFLKSETFTESSKPVIKVNYDIA